MDKIEAYVEAMFSSLPHTPTAMQIKQDLLNDMHERYDELRQQGMSENEALGAVISQFGNIEELRNTLNHEEQKASSSSRTSESPSMPTLPIIFPPFLLLFILKNRDWFALFLLLLSVGIYLILGFTIHFWHPGWVLIIGAEIIILIRYFSSGQANPCRASGR